MRITIEKPGRSTKDSYSALLEQARPQIIRSSREHARCLRIVEDLLAKKNLLGPEKRLLDLLSLLIERYETERYGTECEADPIDVLRELMDARGMKQGDLTPFFGSKGVASEVLNRRRGISKNAARALAEHFNVPIGVFL